MSSGNDSDAKDKQKGDLDSSSDDEEEDQGSDDDSEDDEAEVKKPVKGR